NVQMERVEDPNLLVHDSGATIPFSHLDRVNRDAVWELLPENIRLLLLAGEARALEYTDVNPARGGGVQCLVKGTPCASAQLLELRFGESLLVNCGGIRQEGPVHCREINGKPGGPRQPHQH